MDGELARTTFRPLRLHRIYRLRLERDGDRVRLITKGGYNWTDRYPWIVEAARKNRVRQFVIDGEAVVLGVDGVSDFDALHSGKQNDEVQLYAFDILALDGDDLRRLPLSMRKANIARILNQDCEAWALRHVVGGWKVVLLQQRSGGSNPSQLQATTTLW
jgi:ATP-dependent DNA ligase